MRKERKVFIFSHPAKNQNCKSYSRIANPTGWLLTNLQMQMTFKIIGNLICKKSKIYCLIKLNVFNGFQNHGHIMLIVVITLFVICHTLKYLLQFLISLPYLVIPAAFEINLPRFVMKKLLLSMIKVHLSSQQDLKSLCSFNLLICLWAVLLCCIRCLSQQSILIKSITVTVTSIAYLIAYQSPGNFFFGEYSLLPSEQKRCLHADNVKEYFAGPRIKIF